MSKITKYIDHMNSIGHNFLEINWNEDITSAWSGKAIPVGNGNILSKDEIKIYVNSLKFQENYIVYNCLLCQTLFVIDIRDENLIRLIKNMQIIASDHINKWNYELNYKDHNFSKEITISKDIFYLSCNEMQIKNLLE